MNDRQKYGEEPMPGTMEYTRVEAGKAFIQLIDAVTKALRKDVAAILRILRIRRH